MLQMVSYFVDDLDGVHEFYRDLFEWPEMASRTDSFRGLTSPAGLQMGFHGDEAYSLLSATKPDCLPHAAPTILTFEVENQDLVGSLASRAVGLGGSIVKAPYRTFYGVWQVVLADPEENLLRINYRFPPQTS